MSRVISTPDINARIDHVQCQCFCCTPKAPSSAFMDKYKRNTTAKVEKDCCDNKVLGSTESVGERAKKRRVKKKDSLKLLRLTCCKVKSSPREESSDGV